jgi:PAS domain S-box-containing protein
MFQAGIRSGRYFRWLGVAALAIGLAGGGLWAQAPAPREPRLTPGEVAWLRQHPVIRLAPTPDYEPVEFFNAAGNYTGLTSEYFRLIEQRLGIRFQVVRLTPEQWQRMPPAQRGADVITASAATPKREEYWSFTATYLELPTYVITRDKAKDGLTLDQLAGQRVAVVSAWAAEEYLRATHTNLIIVPVPDVPAGLQKVSFGKVDAFVSELPAAVVWMEKDGLSNLKVSAPAGYTYRLGISVRKDWPELRGILDQTLATITPEERQQIFNHWVKLKTPAEQRLEQKHRQLWWGAAGLTALLLAALFLIRRLAAQVRERTRAIGLSEEKFSKAFRASPDGMAISELETGRYVDINEGYCRMFGFARDEMLNHTSVELGLWHNLEDRRRLVQALKTSGEAHGLEALMLTRDHQPRVIQISGVAIAIGGTACLVSSLRDITGRVRAEQALRESEEKFSKAFHTSPDMMSIIDLETDRYLDINDAHERIFGFPRAEAVGRTPRELGLLANPEEREQLVAELRANSAVRNREVPALSRNGGPLVMLYSAGLITLGNRRCILGVSRDITDQKRAEAERGEAVVREQKARIEYTLQLIASQEAERKRIASELHDSLGQSLLLIKNHTQLALHSPDAAFMREQVDAINQLAAQSIAEARRISRDLHPHQLDHLGLKRALEAMLENAAQASPIQFSVRFEPVDDLFPAEAAMNLYRIAQESLNNILKHSQARRAEFCLERDVHEVRLRIQDDGAGFDAQNPGAPKGLGLKNITERVRMLGAAFKVDSAPGQGTRLEVVIPIAEKTE